jgi:hypothetical protein
VGVVAAVGVEVVGVLASAVVTGLAAAVPLAVLRAPPTEGAIAIAGSGTVPLMSSSVSCGGNEGSEQALPSKSATASA